MVLQTHIKLKKRTENLINYDSDLLLLGSCFSENIGKKLTYFKLQSSVNPTGILFHPKAIEKLLYKAINQQVFTEKDVFFHNERWHSFDAHSNLSSTTKETLLTRLNEATKLTSEKIKVASHIVITLGTSWVYRFLKTDSLVTNCHKVSQKEFRKNILSVNEISKSLQAINTLIHSINKNATIIYTVSPVRHLKDGFIENQQSKAHLITAIHSVLNENTIVYFPSYEIQMDELRDYRFYSEDMIHPNQIAINYIWNKFCDVWLDDFTLKTMLEIDKIQKGLAHRPFNQNSNEHQKFQQKLLDRIKIIQKKHSHIAF